MKNIMQERGKASSWPFCQLLFSLQFRVFKLFSHILSQWFWDLLKADSPNITNTLWNKAELVGLALSQRNEGKNGVYWELEIWSKANLPMWEDLIRIRNHHECRIDENSKMKILRWRIQRMLGCKLFIDAFHLKSWWVYWWNPMIKNQTIFLGMTVLEK